MRRFFCPSCGRLKLDSRFFTPLFEEKRLGLIHQVMATAKMRHLRIRLTHWHWRLLHRKKPLVVWTVWMLQPSLSCPPPGAKLKTFFSATYYTNG